MGYYINGVMCDTYVHLDKRRMGNTVRISESDSESHNIVVYFYCNDKEFPLESMAGLTVRCYIRYNTGEETIECNIGDKGETIIPLRKDLCVQGQHLTCEIVVEGTHEEEAFRYRAFEFKAVVVP